MQKMITSIVVAALTTIPLTVSADATLKGYKESGPTPKVRQAPHPDALPARRDNRGGHCPGPMPRTGLDDAERPATRG